MCRTIDNQILESAVDILKGVNLEVEFSHNELKAIGLISRGWRKVMSSRERIDQCVKQIEKFHRRADETLLNLWKGRLLDAIQVNNIE